MAKYLYAYPDDVLNVTKNVRHDSDYNLFLKKGSKVKFVNPSDISTFTRLPCYLFRQGDFLEVIVLVDVSTDASQNGKTWHIPAAFLRTDTRNSVKDIVLGAIEEGWWFETSVQIKDKETGTYLPRYSTVVIQKPDSAIGMSELAP